VAVAGVLGAQQRNDNRQAPRAQAPHAQAPRAQAPQQRAQPSRGQMENRGRQNVRPQQYAATRPDPRGGNGYQPRNDPRGGNGYQPRNDPRGRPVAGNGGEFRGREGYRPPVAQHGRPLITRGGVYGRPNYGGSRYGYAGYNRFGGRLALPFGWESRIVVRGYFPFAYSSYCEAVPAEYEYMLPEMMPDYDSCLFGDRVVVIDRFSRGIVFSAMLR
jgi:hypothetical protein